MQSLTQNSTPSKERLLGLDVLRGLAVLMVLGHHLPRLSAEEGSGGVMNWWIDAWRRGGWVGVDLFFVLSGFLVSGLLFTEFRAKGTLSVSRFYVRRGWKIYPPFIVLIAVTVLVHLSVRRSVDLEALVAECLFLQSYLPGLWNHTWSLAVEEHFYILLPISLLTMMMFNRGQRNPFAGLLPVVVAMCAIAVLTLRLHNYVRVPEYRHYVHLTPTHLRIDSLLFGVLIAYAYHFHQDQFVKTLRRVRVPLCVTGIVLLAVPFVYDRTDHAFVYTIGPTMYYLGAGALMAGVLLVPIPRNRALAPLTLIGVHSYSIYLWHMPVMRWGAPNLEVLLGIEFGMWTLLMLHLGGSVVVGIVMAKAIETPALRLRDRWFPNPSNSLSPQAPSPPVTLPTTSLLADGVPVDFGKG